MDVDPGGATWRTGLSVGPGYGGAASTAVQAANRASNSAAKSAPVRNSGSGGNGDSAASSETAAASTAAALRHPPRITTHTLYKHTFDTSKQFRSQRTPALRLAAGPLSTVPTGRLCEPRQLTGASSWRRELAEPGLAPTAHRPTLSSVGNGTERTGGKVASADRRRQVDPPSLRARYDRPRWQLAIGDQPAIRRTTWLIGDVRLAHRCYKATIRARDSEDLRGSQTRTSPFGVWKTAATTRSGARCKSFPAKQPPMQ